MLYKLTVSLSDIPSACSQLRFVISTITSSRPLAAVSLHGKKLSGRPHSTERKVADLRLDIQSAPCSKPFGDLNRLNTPPAPAHAMTSGVFGRGVSVFFARFIHPMKFKFDPPAQNTSGVVR